MDIVVVLLIGIISVSVIVIGFYLYKRAKPKNNVDANIRADSPAQFYNITGGDANVWWNDTEVTGPDTINPDTGEPFIINHIRNITIKAIDVPLEVTVSPRIRYSKVRIHPTLDDFVTNSTSKTPADVFPISKTDRYYTMETIWMVNSLKRTESL